MRMLLNVVMVEVGNAVGVVIDIVGFGVVGCDVHEQCGAFVAVVVVAENVAVVAAVVVIGVQ